jgi:hypothetical protein
MGKTALHLDSMNSQRPEYELKLLQDTLSGIGKIVSDCQQELVNPNHSQIMVLNIEDGAIEGDINWIEDYENILIENMIGTAFVLCQTFITLIVSEIWKLHETCKSISISLTTTTQNKNDILVYSSPQIGKSGVTPIQVMNAMANYFKHHEEWHGSWAKPSSKQMADTVTILQAIEIGEGSITANRYAIKILGVADGHSLDDLNTGLTKWMNALYDAYDLELHSLGLI